MINCDYIEKNFLSTFESALANIEYEHKGIWFSEMLFIFSICQYFKPKLLIESGRARGQSTLCLSHLFPNQNIISIEHLKDTEDSRIAEKRLMNCKNLMLIYGDSFYCIKKINYETQFLMLIDGPKNEMAIDLAKKVLQNKFCLGVFLHDCNVGGVERSFENLHNGFSLFSDDLQFAEKFKYLDSACYNEKRKPYLFGGVKQKSYGPTVGVFLKPELINDKFLNNFIIQE